MSWSRRLALSVVAVLLAVLTGCTFDVAVLYGSSPAVAPSSGYAVDGGTGDGGLPLFTGSDGGGGGHRAGASSPYAYPVGPAGGALTGTYPNPGLDAGAISAAAGVSYVFQPGGTAAGNVYTSWASLYAVLSTTPGPKWVEIDDSHTSPAVIPAGAYNLDQVTLTANSNYNNNNGAAILSLASGVTVTASYLHITGWLQVTSAPAASVITVLTGHELNLLVDNQASLQSTSASAIVEVQSGAWLWSEIGASGIVGDGTHAAITLDSGAGGTCILSGTLTAHAYGGAGSTFLSDRVGGVLGASQAAGVVVSYAAGLGPTGASVALSPTGLAQATATTDVATQSLTLLPQAPLASAVTNINSGSFIVNSVNGTASGLFGLNRFQSNGFDAVTLGTYGGVAGGSGSYGAIWFMAAGAPSASNFGFLGNQSISYVNNPTQVSLSLGGSSGTGLDLTSTTAKWHAPTLEWLGTVSSPTLTHLAPASDLPTTPLTIASEAPFAGAVTNLTPGSLVLNVPAPVGAGATGFVKVQNGGTNVWQMGFLTTTNAYSGLYPIGVVPSGINYALASTNDTSTILNATTAVDLSLSNAIQLQVLSSAINLTPPSLSWGSGVSAPSITEAALASTSAGSGAAGQPMYVTPQAGQAATGAGNNGGNGVDLVLSGGAGGTSGSATAGTGGFVQIANTSGTLARLGLLSGQSGTTYGALYPGNVTPGASNYVMYWQNTGSTGPTSLQFASSSAIGLNTGGSARVQVAAGGLSLAIPIAGLGTTPLSLSGEASPNTVACGTGGTQTISAAQAIIPFFQVTGGTLTSDCILDFGTNGVTGLWEIAVPAAGFTSLNGHNLSIKNGTTTLSYAALPTHALIDVRTFGTNSLAVAP